VTKEANDQRPEREKFPDQLLFTRAQVARLLGGVDVSTVRRLERDGRLRPIRLNKKSTSGMVFFAASDVNRLVEELAGRS
jgi:hypothetical protein